jgi:hypothetical protein
MKVSMMTRFRNQRMSTTVTLTANQVQSGNINLAFTHNTRITSGIGFNVSSIVGFVSTNFSSLTQSEQTQTTALRQLNDTKRWNMKSQVNLSQSACKLHCVRV